MGPQGPTEENSQLIRQNVKMLKFQEVQIPCIASISC